MLKLNDIYLIQQGNMYGMLLQNGDEISECMLPSDGNFTQDDSALQMITRALKVRVDAYNGSQILFNGTYTNRKIINGILVEQSNNMYHLIAPGIGLVEKIMMPPDGLFVADYHALDIITKAMALRWGVNPGTKQLGKYHHSKTNSTNNSSKH